MIERVKVLKEEKEIERKVFLII